MRIVILQGGIGNQLFQLSFYLYLAKARSREKVYLYSGNVAQGALSSKELLMALSSSQKVKLFFGLRNYLVSPENFARAINYGRRCRFFTKYISFEEFQEKPFFRDINNSHKILFSGYFQDISVLEIVAEDLKEIITEKLLNVTLDLKNRLNLPKDFAAVHVRGGDYYTQKKELHRLGILHKKFFSKIRELADDLPILLLTQDKKQITEMISDINPDFILDGSMCSAFETLALLSDAKVMLGSNSSLSWWGSWLGTAGRKLYLPSDWDPTGVSIKELGLYHQRLSLIPPIWVK